MTGIVMKAIGVDAHIYERSPKVLDDRGAGIVMQAETETFLTQYAGLRREQAGVWLNTGNISIAREPRIAIKKCPNA